MQFSDCVHACHLPSSVCMLVTCQSLSFHPSTTALGAPVGLWDTLGFKV